MYTVPRYLKKELLNKIRPGKVVVLYGPRQVGKTTLMQELLRSFPPEEVLVVSGENKDVEGWLSSQSIETLRHFIGTKTLLAIDEAQKVAHIGLNLKLIVDHFPQVRVFVTGSSSFEISQKLGDPLVGRQWEYYLFPMAQLELKEYEPLHISRAQLPQKLILGSYPEVLSLQDREDKMQLLIGLVENYLYKDILEFQDIRKADKIHDLLRLIAFQIGKEVSLNELGTQLHLDLRTVERYLDLLEKVFILKKIRGFSRNLRKEITKNARYYFLDNGIRNAVIRNFNSLENRQDVGELWENYVVAERLKKQHYYKKWASFYFWRTYDQKEIDWVEESEGSLSGYEIKWSEKKRRVPALWKETYPHATYTVISPENYLEFIT